MGLVVVVVKEQVASNSSSMLISMEDGDHQYHRRQQVDIQKVLKLNKLQQVKIFHDFYFVMSNQYLHRFILRY